MQEAYNQSGIYTMEETENEVRLTLNPEVAEAEMVDLLADFYKLRYSDENSKWQEELEEIKKRHTLDEWMELADDSSLTKFQLDRYVWISTPFSRGWSYSLPTEATQIVLSSDGKILMECYGRLFKFFTRLIRERLSKYRLANALFVSISG